MSAEGAQGFTCAETHRQSALPAASPHAADDQASVDAISSEADSDDHTARVDEAIRIVTERSRALNDRLA